MGFAECSMSGTEGTTATYNVSLRYVSALSTNGSREGGGTSAAPSRYRRGLRNGTQPSGSRGSILAMAGVRISVSHSRAQLF